MVSMVHTIQAFLTQEVVNYSKIHKTVILPGVSVCQLSPSV